MRGPRAQLCAPTESCPMIIRYVPRLATRGTPVSYCMQVPHAACAIPCHVRVTCCIVVKNVRQRCLLVHPTNEMLATTTDTHVVPRSCAEIKPSSLAARRCTTAQPQARNRVRCICISATIPQQHPRINVQQPATATRWQLHYHSSGWAQCLRTMQRYPMHTQTHIHTHTHTCGSLLFTNARASHR